MGISDRRYDERRPPDQSFWRRVMGEGDNFFMWAFKIFRVAGISVRIHLFFVIYVAAELINAWRNDQVYINFVAMRLACLFTLVLLHEFGHCLACRRVGGEAEDIILWPLGGLAMCRPPNSWKAHLITTIGGPAVNLALLPVFGAVLYFMTGQWGAVFFSIMEPQNAIKFGYVTTTAERWVYFAHLMNFWLLAFNVLLPMYPMDGGRIMQELLWWRLGRERSLDIAANVGFFFAIAVGAYAIFSGNNLLFGIAVFAGLACWRAKANRRFMADEGPEFATAYMKPAAQARDQAKYREALKQQQKDQTEAVEVDRILAKISSQGMDSLSRSERKTLERDTERRRGGRT